MDNSKCNAPKLTQYSLMIEGRLLGANQLNNYHWRKQRRHMKKIAQSFLLAAYATNGPDQPLRYSQIAIVSYRKRLLDYDNLVAGAKAYVDALMLPQAKMLRSGQIRSKPGIGWIYDDSPDHVRVTYEQIVSTAEYVEITVAQAKPW